MKHSHRLVFVIACLCLFFTRPAYALNIGDPFPDFNVDNTLSPDESAYLKVPYQGKVQLSKIQAEVIIIEFLNVYCHTCRMQVSIFNELKAAIDKDPDLRGKVCMLGLAVGNSVEEIADFKAEFGVQYPVLSDQDKELFNMTGNIRGTPHTYIIRRDDRGFIVDYHAGGVSSAERYIESIRHTLRSSLVGTQPGNIMPQIEFSAAGEKISTASMNNQRYILYFASSLQREIDNDLRSMPLQLAVLSSLAGQSPVKIFVFPPAPGDCAGHEIPGPLVCAHDEGNAIRDLLGSGDEPVLLCVNEYGRIVYRAESLARLAAEKIYQGSEYKPEPKMSAEDIQALISRSVEAAGHRVAAIEHLTLENHKDIYVITAAPQGSGVFFFARVESGITMCDVCHDTHFVYVFDQKGIVVDFIPLEITKYGNVAWTEDDGAKMKQNLAGRSIFEPFEFDPKVDAVTSATMSSSLIYEAMNNAREYFKDFYEYSFREAYWKKRCFSVICKVKEAVMQASQEPGFVFDDAALQKILAGSGLNGCPTGGMYIVIDNDILCSQHGLNMDGCTH